MHREHWVKAKRPAFSCSRSNESEPSEQSINSAVCSHGLFGGACLIATSLVRRCVAVALRRRRYGLTTHADQKIGRDAVERYQLLRKELDTLLAELNPIIQ